MTGIPAPGPALTLVQSADGDERASRGMAPQRMSDHERPDIPAATGSAPSTRGELDQRDPPGANPPAPRAPDGRNGHGAAQWGPDGQGPPARQALRTPAPPPAAPPREPAGAGRRSVRSRLSRRQGEGSSLRLVDPPVGGSPPGPTAAPPASFGPDEPAPPVVKPRIKKLRLALILGAVLILGLVSFVFGMFMAVASDLPSLDNRAEFNNAKNSILLDDQGRTLGVLAQQGRILVTPGDIPPIVREAVISIEDKRFNTNSGIDLRGIARAFSQDVLHKKGVQGASTIPQQFVKNALQAQSHRTIFEKLREAALAYHLTRKWSKKKILTEYLNTIYFGNGAYGVESAARTYFGRDVNHRGCGTITHTCVYELKPWEAALLAGMIASPTGYDPIQHPVASKARRDLVLRDMLEQGYLTRQQYDASVTQSLPAAADIQPPHQAQVPGLQTGYFTDWVRQQVIDRYGPQRAFDGGLTIRTTLDLDLQRAAETAVNNYLAAPSGPSASLVAIDNATGEVRAMVGGRDFKSARSTWPPRGSASRAPRSRPSCWPRRCARASRPTRCGPRESRSSRCPAAAARRGSWSTTTTTSIRARRHSPRRPPTPTTRSSPRWASTRAPARSRPSLTGWESARRYRPTRR